EAARPPLLHPCGLALREVPAHRKWRLRQVERALVVGLRVVRHRALPLPFGGAEKRPGGVAIAPDLGGQLLERGERRLVAQLVVELDGEAPAVEVARKIEEERFESRRAAF